MNRLSTKDVPAVREQRRHQQNDRCPLCLKKISAGEACLDHDHTTGDIRGVLCRNCNSMEGKVRTASIRAKRQRTPLEWLQSLVKYLEWYQENPTRIKHPTFRTLDEKKELQKKRRRKRK